MRTGIGDGRLAGFARGNRPFAQSVESFVTDDFGRARERLFSAYLRHRFECRRPAAGYRFALERLQLPEIAVNVIGFGRQTLVEAPPIEAFYCLQLSVRGVCRIEQGGATVELTPGSLYVISPHHPLRQLHSAGYVQINARIGRRLLEDFAAAACGGEPARVDFLRAALPAAGRARPLAGYLRYLCEESASDLAPDYDPAAGALAERTLLSLLLAAVPSARPLPRMVCEPLALRRAEAFLEAHAGEPLAVAAIAAAAGVSERTLYDLCRRHRGIGPMAILKELRLARARELLQRADARTDSVTAAAYASGFNHLSKFAADYRHRYGERPRDTLARARQSTGGV